MCQQPRKIQDTQYVIYRKWKIPLISMPCISETTWQIFTKFTKFMLYIYMTLHIEFERKQVSGTQDVHLQKLPNFLHMFLLHTAFQLCKINIFMDPFLSNLVHH